MFCARISKRKAKPHSSESDSESLVSADSDPDTEIGDLLRLPPVGRAPHSPLKKVKVTGPVTRNQVKVTEATRHHSESRTDRHSRSGLLGAMETSAYHEIMSATSMMSLTNQVKVTGFKSKGQLWVSLQVSRGTLSVNVVQAKGLSSRWRPLCNTYVQVLLVPDDQKKSQCVTEVKYETNHPQFGERFTYELVPEDERKRLLISVWHKDTQKNCSEFLGCMSFGMRHLVSRAARQAVEGWYYLLSENLGHRKHLLAQTASQPHSGSLTSLTSAGMTTGERIPEVNTQLQDMEAHSMVICKNQAGYGFTVRGSCPVRVGRVKGGSTSQEAGLRTGDYIVRINGQNVSRSRPESVAEIVRKSENLIVLDIRRPVKSPDCDLDKTCPLVCLLGKDAVDDFLKPDGQESNPIEQDENQPPSNHSWLLGNSKTHYSNKVTNGNQSERKLLWTAEDKIKKLEGYRSKSVKGVHPGKDRTIPKQTILSNSDSAYSSRHGNCSSHGSSIQGNCNYGKHVQGNASYGTTQGEINHDNSVHSKNSHGNSGHGNNCHGNPCRVDVPGNSVSHVSVTGGIVTGPTAHHRSNTPVTLPNVSQSAAMETEQRRSDAGLHSIIDEFEMAVVEDSDSPDSTFPSLGESRPHYEKWDPGISIITRADSVRSVYYDSHCHLNSTVSCQSPTNWVRSTQGSTDWSQYDLTQYNTLNDFCESYAHNNTMVNDELDGREQMCSELSPGVHDLETSSMNTRHDFHSNHTSWFTWSQTTEMEEPSYHNNHSSLPPSLYGYECVERTLVADDSIDGGRRLPLRSSTPELPTCTSQCLEESVLDEHHSAIYRVLRCEEEFCRQMQVGIQRFSRPLRHSIISPWQHKALFQNIEKLVALSEYHIRQLIERSYCAETTLPENLSKISIDSVSSVYEPKIHILCEAYDLYYYGLQSALAALDSLQCHKEFSRFVAGNYGDLSIKEFLQKPVRHLSDLYTALVEVQRTTTPSDPDHEHLLPVIKSLRASCCEVVPGNDS